MIQELRRKGRRDIMALTILSFLVFTNGYSMSKAEDELVNDDFRVHITQNEGSITQNCVHVDTDYETFHASYGIYTLDVLQQGGFVFNKGTQVSFSGDFYPVGQGVFRLDLIRSGITYMETFSCQE